MSKYSRSYYLKNKEKYREYRRTNKERVDENHRRYRTKNKARINKNERERRKLKRKLAFRSSAILYVEEGLLNRQEYELMDATDFYCWLRLFNRSIR